MTAHDDQVTIQVTVTHGDLRHAAYPLAVGHYRQDVIVSAEAQLNAALGNVLRQRFDLGRYPGRIGTHAIFRHGIRPRGAIVVGLGDVGELTPERLRETFAAALKEYALEVAHDPRSPVNERGYRSAAFSTLLVGTDGGSSGTLADAVLAILRAAVDTNRALGNSALLGTVRIDAVEFVELYEDTATRAAHVIADLPGALQRELKQHEGLTGSKTVSTAPGSRYLRPPNPYVIGWWQRIAVQQKTSGDSGKPRSDSATEIKFTVLTDRARLEQDVTTGQRALVQELIAAATANTNVDLDLSATLYQLLVPTAVRDRISQGADVLFMLDRVGAGFPFELMAARGNDGRPHPLIESHGVLRQFETEHYEARPEMARSNRMFVVGNPRTLLWPNLPGAEKEAAAVEKVATANGLQVEHPQRDAQQMITKLMTGEYQIVHIAAHGQYDPDPMKSGVVMSDRLFVTPAEVARLPLVPELVFLNCCYLGKMDEGRSTSPDPRLASSLAEGFIRAGARAVIAAGWAVDDNAGTTFATTFYEQFLAGATFGDAVKRARQDTAKGHPNSNTWGAYQCYGNPDFRFRQTAENQVGPTAISLVSRSEALQALRTLASSARGMGLDDVPWLTTQFDDTFGAIADDWRQEGEVLTVAGEIAGELELFERAIDYYRRALASLTASASFVAIEQLANLLARHAAAKVIATGVVDPADVAAFGEALEWLDWLDQRLPVTKERRSLRGSLYKRLAASVPSSRLEYLAKARESYGVGAAATAEYQSLNALALAFVLADAPARQSLVLHADRFWEALPQQPLGADRDFWDLVTAPDTQLLRRVLRQSLDEAAIDDLQSAYAKALQARPSPRQWASVTDHIWFLHAMTGDSGLPCHDPATSAALKELHRILVTRASPPPATPLPAPREAPAGEAAAAGARRPVKATRKRRATKQ
jgi:CHAT domain-containing protein